MKDGGEKHERRELIAKRDNGSGEIAGKITALTAWIKQICLPRVLCKVLNRKTLFAETFCFWSNLLFFHELLIGPQPTFSKCIVSLFSCNPIGQLCLSGPG